LNVRPIAGALGAEIDGVDLAQLADGEIAAIKAALWEHLVLFFRDQRLTPEDQCAFTRHFGALTRPAAAGAVPGHPDMTLVRREADTPKERINFGGYWHSDQSFREKPAAGFTLYAVEVPPSGGDTLFENLYLAYESLSPGMRALLDRIVAVHSYAAGSDPDRGYGDPNADRDVARFPDVEHPLVRTHPESGRNALYLSGSWLLRFRDMTEEESRPLLDFLYAHAARPEFTCRFHWTPGALALLDNRCTQHFAINDYAGHRRILHRVMFAGDRPVGPALPLSS